MSFHVDSLEISCERTATAASRVQEFYRSSELRNSRQGPSTWRSL